MTLKYKNLKCEFSIFKPNEVNMFDYFNKTSITFTLRKKNMSFVYPTI